MNKNNIITQIEAIQIFLDFIASRPTDDEILSFSFPKRIQDRIQELVTKNNAGTITTKELVELKEYERLDVYGRLLKTKIAMKRKQTSIPA
ncbi:MAG: hypothetical protein ACE5IW_13915 [bacterium]